MRTRVLRYVLLALAAVAVVEAAPPPSKTVVLTCEPGSRATAVGSYGGVGISVSCQNGRGNQRLTGLAGTAYTIRMGVETPSTGGDCFWTGDDEIVEESCLGVGLSIR